MHPLKPVVKGVQAAGYSLLTLGSAVACVPMTVVVVGGACITKITDVPLILGVGGLYACGMSASFFGRKTTHKLGRMLGKDSHKSQDTPSPRLKLTGQ